MLDRVEEYQTKAGTFIGSFVEVFARSDKKTYKENLAGFFATADACIDYVKEPYTKFEERLPDKWNEIFKAMQEKGLMRVLATKEESTVLDSNAILVEQMRSKIGGQLVEIAC
jgi:hypothetical protein